MRCSPSLYACRPLCAPLLSTSPPLYFPTPTEILAADRHSSTVGALVIAPSDDFPGSTAQQGPSVGSLAASAVALCWPASDDDTAPLPPYVHNTSSAADAPHSNCGREVMTSADLRRVRVLVTDEKGQTALAGEAGLCKVCAQCRGEGGAWLHPQRGNAPLCMLFVALRWTVTRLPHGTCFALQITFASGSVLAVGDVSVIQAGVAMFPTLVVRACAALAYQCARACESAAANRGSSRDLWQRSPRARTHVALFLFGILLVRCVCRWWVKLTACRRRE
jgi:hypothetical protein